MMTRRQLTALAGVLATPWIATAAQANILVLEPRIALKSLDAVWTTEQVTRAFPLAVSEQGNRQHTNAQTGVHVAEMGSSQDLGTEIEARRNYLMV
jgi:hypothetical protein